jgi:peroxiredoxin
MRKRKPYFSLRIVLLITALAALVQPIHAEDKWNKTRLPNGTDAPDFTLPRLEITTDDDGNNSGSITKKTVTLSEFRKKQVVVLFFSSYTWGPFKKAASSVDTLYREYKDNKEVTFFFVYIREAHPAKNPSKPDQIAKHVKIDDRINAAMKCVAGLKMTVPFLIDGMDGNTQRNYRAAYACTTVIGKDGKIAFHSRGPHGTQPKEAKKVIDKLLAAKAEPKSETK